MNYERGRHNPFPVTETYFREVGLHRYDLLDGKKLTGLSANTWEEYEKLLLKTSSQDKIVVSPELITYTGGSFGDMEKSKGLISERLDKVFSFSLIRPKTMFVVGSPLFVETEKPKNSVLLIKNGEVIGVTNKRSGATKEENEAFDLVAEEPPFLIPGTKTSLLICADLPTASIFSGTNNDLLNSTLDLANRKHLIGKKLDLIPSSATSLLVVACWGVGGVDDGRGRR